MELFIFIAVVVIFYMLNKDYNPSNYQNIKINQTQKLQGELIDHEAGLLIALMAKVAKADGHICELEAEVLSHTFTDVASVFENSSEIREQLKQIYKKEKETFENTIIISEKYYKLTKFDYTKRLKVLEYLLNLAFIDGEFSDAENMIIEDIASALQIKSNDLQNLITQFRQYYTQKSQEQSMNLQKAYEILGVDSTASEAQIKKAYRTLVKQYHPDVVTGKGASESIIEEATKKLQEINEAYELIKKHKK